MIPNDEHFIDEHQHSSEAPAVVNKAYGYGIEVVAVKEAWMYGTEGIIYVYK